MNEIKQFVNGFTINTDFNTIIELKKRISDWLDKHDCNSSQEYSFDLFGSKNGYDEFSDDEICLFVHLYKPIRKLGTIAKAPKSIKIDTIPSELQYCMIPLSFHDKQINQNDRKPINIITKKRGLWLVVKGFEQLQHKTEEELFSIYEQYVAGMQYNPKKCKYETFPQYNLDYPMKIPWDQGDKIIYKRKNPTNIKKKKTLKMVTVDNKPKKKKQKLKYNIPESLEIEPLIRESELNGDLGALDSDNCSVDSFYRDVDGKVTNKDVYDEDEENRDLYY